jgi:hypothetical protein
MHGHFISNGVTTMRNNMRAQDLANKAATSYQNLGREFLTNNEALMLMKELELSMFLMAHLGTAPTGVLPSVLRRQHLKLIKAAPQIFLGAVMLYFCKSTDEL